LCNSQKDNEIVQILSQNISQKVVNTLLKWFKEDATEGLEEVFTDIVNKVAQKLTYADKMTWEKVFSTEDAWDSFLSGLLLSRGMNGADAIIVNSNAFQNAGLEDIAGKLSRGEALSVAEQQRLLDAVLKNTAPGTAADSNQSSRVTESGKFGMTGWDGRVAVEPATGPKVTVGGKTYELIGYDKDGAKVYQDAEVLESVKENATADQKETNPTESGLESVENPENRDTIKLPDIQIGRSLGAKAKNYQVMDMSTGEMFNLVEGTKLQNVEVFAGKGTKTPYRNAYKYANVHGGKVEEWQHVKGEGWVACMDGDRYAEIHWSQCEGRGKHDLFIKRWKDEG